MVPVNPPSLTPQYPAPDALAEASCPACAYPLRGLMADRCPECGLAFDRQSFQSSKIPWEHRRAIGGWRAYWLTVGMVMFRPGAVAAALDSPIYYRPARRFWWITIAVWTLLIFAALGLFMADLCAAFFQWVGPVAGVAFAASVPLSLMGLTAAPANHCHSPTSETLRQNRAIALTYYHSALLYWAPAVAGASWLAAQWTFDRWGPSPLSFVVALAVLALGVWYFTLRMRAILSRVQGPGRERTKAVRSAIIGSACWFVAGLLFPGAIVLYLVIVYESLI